MKRNAICYYVGFIHVDRDSDRNVARLADEYYTKYLRGRGTLVQRRVGPSMFEYWFIPWDLAAA